MKPWHEDDELWRVRGPFQFGPGVWARTPGEVDAALALMDLPEGAAILDLCCGPGRHSLELARRGFRVTGVDRTRLYLDEARGRAAAEGLAVEWVEEDAREFRREGAFDAAISMCTSFGYFEDEADDRRVVDNVHASLREGGRLLMDLMGKEVLARTWTPRMWDEVGGVYAVVERTVERDWTRVVNHETYLDGGKRWEVQLDHRIYSAAELKALLRTGGFGEVRVFGDLDGAAYDTDAKRLVALATRTACDSGCR